MRPSKSDLNQTSFLFTKFCSCSRPLRLQPEQRIHKYGNRETETDKLKIRRAGSELTLVNILLGFTFLTPLVYMVHQLSRSDCLERAKKPASLKIHNSFVNQWYSTVSSPRIDRMASAIMH